MPVVLENEQLRLVVAPGRGASVLALQARRGEVWLPLMPDATEPESDPRFASFLMVPYSNRIARGAFPFGGRRYQLRRAADHAIHGDVRGRPWTVAAHRTACVSCRFSSADHEDVDWPWPFAVQADYQLEGSSVVSRLALWNRGGEPMPAGFGWHPYFRRSLTVPDEPVLLRLNVSAAYPDAAGTRIPSGPPEPLTPHQDFSVERQLKPDHFLDTCFRGYDGDGTLAWPDSGVRLRLECSAACTHLVLYNPADKPYFAVEPVTHANDGVNLLARGDAEAGTVVLEPGASLAASFVLHVDVEA